MSKWTEKFQELYTNTNRILNMEEYEFCMKEFNKRHETRAVIQWILAIVCFCIGLWFFIEGAVIGAVFLISLAAYFNINSTNHALVSDLIYANRIQAMLIHNNTNILNSIHSKLETEKINNTSND